MKKRAKGRPKKKYGHKAEQVSFRVTPETKAKYERAADAQHMELSDWYRYILDEAARRVLGEERDD